MSPEQRQQRHSSLLLLFFSCLVFTQADEWIRFVLWLAVGLNFVLMPTYGLN